MNKKRILVVDDSDFDRDLLKRTLTRKGRFTVLQASSEEECLKVLETKSVDLVLLDIMMPGSYGSQTLLQIRKKFNAIELPVIMVTVKSEAADVVECLQNGANDYITKPVNFEVAFERIATHLHLSEVSMTMSQVQQFSTLEALVTTYNHEINNLLSVALGCLNQNIKEDEKVIERLRNSLWKIAGVMKNLKTIAQQGNINLDQYSGPTKFLKINE